MEVIKITIKANNTERFTWQILRDNHLPFAPANEFLKYLDSTDKSINTVKSYAHHLKHYFNFLQQTGTDWKNAKFETLADFVGYLKHPDRLPNTSPDSMGAQTAENKILMFPQSAYTDANVLPAKTKRSNSTINVMIAAVTSFYTYHARLETVPELNIHSLFRTSSLGATRYKSFLHNIAPNSEKGRNALKLRTKKQFPKTISLEEFVRLTSFCSRIRDRFLLCLLYETGLRIGQALGLRHEDIRSFDNEIIVCPRTDNVNGARAKTLSPYTVHVSEELMRLYALYLTEEYGDFESDYVFLNLWGEPVGRPMAYTSVLDLFRRLEEKTGIYIRPHMLRHTHATDLMRATGGRADLVSKRLGHKSIQTTINTYSHLTPEEVKQAYRQYESRRHLSEEKGGKLIYG